MKEKFISYMQEVGIRYALTFAKYEGIKLAVVQLWIQQAEPTTTPEQMADVTWMYNMIHLSNKK